MNTRVIDMLTRLAIENPGVRSKYKIAAGVVYKKNLIATGINSYKTHPLMWEFGKNQDSLFLHAEIDAIKNSLRLITQEQLTKCDMYIVRVKRSQTNKRWVFGLAKPCKGCQRAIESFNVKNIFYTTDENNIVSACSCTV